LLHQSTIHQSNRRIGYEKLLAEKERRNRDVSARTDLANRLDEIRHNCLTLHGFTKEAWHVLEPTTPFKDNWHIGAICYHLEAVNRKEIPFLVINLPPGVMKSLTVSVVFNPWEWGPAKQPGLRYITSSYREDLTDRDARKSRNLIQSEWYQTLWPEVKLTRKGDTEYENTFLGRRKAIPFMSLTGDRGNRIIIDDPHSIRAAESEVQRPATVQLFREMVPSRTNDPMTDSIMIMAQRTHPEDICGILEELGIKNIVRLVLPMEYEPSLSMTTSWFSPTLDKQMSFTDPRTTRGELLHPERISQERLKSDKILYGPHAYDTQFQQRPRARDGAYYFSDKNVLVEQADKSLAPVMDILRLDTVFAVADTASKVGAKRDGSGVMYCGFVRHPKPQAYILDWDLQQIQADVLEHWLPGVLRRCEELSIQFKARAGSQGAFVEDKDSGVALLQSAAKKRLPVRAIPSAFTAMGKEGRAVSVSGYVYQGNIKFWHEAYDKVVVYKGRSKNHAYDQITTFRMGKGTPLDEDEMFDCFCYIAGLCFGDFKGT
jgi:hypothetical protein